MGKQSQFSGEPRKSLLPKAAGQFYDVILEEMISKSEEKVDPPKYLQEFEDKLSKLVEERFERNLGLQHYLQNRKYIKSEPTVENLIEIECELEKQSLNGVLIINQQLDPYKYLKLALERNCPFTVRAQHFLGVFIDRSGITKSDKRRIGVQAAAQVLWHQYKEDIPFTTDIRKKICHDKSILEFLDIYDSLEPKVNKNNESKYRGLENHIRKVNPVPENLRRGWHTQISQTESKYYSIIKPIPRIFLKNPFRINFQKLRIAIIALTKIQALLGMSLEEIKSGGILQVYKGPLKYYLIDFVNDWAEEVFSAHRDGKIFDF